MFDRRQFFIGALAAGAALSGKQAAHAQAAMSRITAYGFSFEGLNGDRIRLAASLASSRSEIPISPMRQEPGKPLCQSAPAWR